MSNPRSSKVSRRKPASVTNLEIKDGGRRSCSNYLGLQLTSDSEDVEHIHSKLGSSSGLTQAPKYQAVNYQTWRLLNSVIEGQWNDAEESLSLGADLTLLALLKDQTRLQEVAWFVARAITGRTQCNQSTVDDEAKQTLLCSVDSTSNSNKIMMVKNNCQATGKEETLAKGDSVSRVFSNTVDSVVKQWFRWGLATVNLGLELCQAVISQEAAVGKITTDRKFLMLSALLSSICLILTIWEISREMRKDGVKWRKEGRYYFFYYPGKEAPPYGSK